MAQEKERPGARDGAPGADRVSQDCGGPDAGKATFCGFDPQASSARKHRPGETADLALDVRRTMWRHHAGRTIPNMGRLASIVALTADGERIAIFAAKGSFRFELDGRRYRCSHLGEGEAVVMGWLMHSEGR